MSYKVTFVGNSNVGKSSLFQRILKNRFYEQRESTIGGAYMKHVTPSNTYEVWDTAGQERYNALIPIYIRDSDIVIFVYDVTDSASFAAVTEHWLPFVSKSLQRRETDTLFILIGNKCDVGDVGNNDSNSEKGADILHRQVHTKQGKDLVENGNFNYFLETSAKQGLATEGIFQVMDDYIAQTRRAPNCSYYSTNTPSLQLSLDALNDRDRTHSSSSCANSC